MRKSLVFLFSMGVILLGAIDAAAQTNQPPPAKVLSIFREDVKAAKGGAHEDLEVGYVKALQKANWPVFGLALTSIAGPNDAWFVTTYPSFEAMEKDREAMGKNAELTKEFNRLDAADAEFRTNQRGIICYLQEDLSFRPAYDVSKVRYFEIITLRVRPGHEGEFREAAKLIRAAYEKANLDAHFNVYQVLYGLPEGTFYVSVPLKSLKEVDWFLDPKNRGTMMAAMGEENGKKFEKLSADSLISSEASLYSINPKMSYVSDQFAKAGGEDFWRPKAMMAMKPAPKKAAEKATAKQQQ